MWAVPGPYEPIKNMYLKIDREARKEKELQSGSAIRRRNHLVEELGRKASSCSMWEAAVAAADCSCCPRCWGAMKKCGVWWLGCCLSFQPPPRPGCTPTPWTHAVWTHLGCASHSPLLKQGVEQLGPWFGGCTWGTWMLEGKPIAGLTHLENESRAGIPSIRVLQLRTCSQGFAGQQVVGLPGRKVTTNSRFATAFPEKPSGHDYW